MVNTVALIPHVKHFSKAIDEPITFYEGKVKVIQGDISECGKGLIELSWFPETHIRFTSFFEPRLNFAREDFKICIKKPSLNLIASFSSLTWFSHPQQDEIFKGRFLQTELIGKIQDKIQVGKFQKSIRYCTFCLPNFFDLENSFWGAKTIDSFYPDFYGGISFVFGEWKISVLSLGETSDIKSAPTSEDLQEELNSKGGFAITNLGLIQRSDGKSFLETDVCSLIDSLTYFLSFSRKNWTSPIIMSGYNQRNNCTWDSWNTSQISSWQVASDNITDTLIDCAQGFYEKWQNSLWQEPIKTAIRWYIESQKKAGGAEGAIVLTQNAFEILSWVYVVEQSGSMSAGGFGGIPATDKLRLLMALLDIPVDIPNSFPELIRFIKEKTADNRDIPQVLAEIRNNIVHSNPKNRKNLSRLSPLALEEAWELGCLCLESILSKIFDAKI